MAQSRQWRACMRASTRSILGSLLLLLATAATAQQLSDHITVNVVEVPVYVSRSGASVNGLTKDDFTLTVNGKPQAIEYFDVLENAAASPADETTQPAQPQRVDVDRRRLIVLLFDLSETSFQSIRRARQAADEFVAAAPAGDVFAVATLTTSGVRFAVPFLNDRVAVRRAIATLRASSANDAFGIATLTSERSSFTAAFHDDAWAREPITGSSYRQVGKTAVEGSKAAEAARIYEKMAADLSREVLTAQRTNVTAHLGPLADRLAPLSGIKHVVLIGDNFSLSTRAVVTASKVRERFRAAGVVLDAVDAAGLQAPWSSNYQDAFFTMTSRLHTLSIDTGGTVTRTLPQLRAAQSTTYILGFRPPAARGRIEVRVRNQPVFTDVHYRGTYEVGATEKSGNEGLFLADVLMNDIPQNGISVGLDVAANADQTLLTASIPGAELLALGDEKVVLEMFLYIFDDAGQAAEWAYYKANVDLVRGRDVLAREPYTITSRVKLEPGHYVGKVVLRAGDERATGFARTEFSTN